MSEPQRVGRIGQDRTETCGRPSQASPGWLATLSIIDKSKAWYLERGPSLPVVLSPFPPEANSVESEEEWRGFCQAVGHPEWLEDERFKDCRSRKMHERELDTLLAAWTRERTQIGIMYLLQNAGVAATPVYDTESLVTDPQFQHREYLVSRGHPVTGNHPVAGIPGKHNAFEPRYTPAPCLGQDNEDVFGNLLGLSRQEIVRLQEEKVIY